MYEHGLIAPVLTLVLWTLVMLVWLYAVRIPAMQKAKIEPQEAAMKRTLDLPPQAMWPADNYNHLLEQPTVFYAACFAAQFSGADDAINIGLGWTYVSLRVVHSLIQATVNIIILRFLIFALSSIALAVLAVRTTWMLFGYV
jgi:hypothetical protein